MLPGSLSCVCWWDFVRCEMGGGTMLEILGAQAWDTEILFSIVLLLGWPGQLTPPPPPPELFLFSAFSTAKGSKLLILPPLEPCSIQEAPRKK